jgi:hypothetical protein
MLAVAKPHDVAILSVVLTRHRNTLDAHARAEPPTFGAIKGRYAVHRHREASEILDMRLQSPRTLAK